MSKIRIELLSWLTETLDAERVNNDVVIEEEIEDGNTVKDLLVKLATKYHRFGQSVFDIKAQKLSGEICVLYNGRYLEVANGLETKLNDEDVIIFFPIIEGG